MKAADAVGMKFGEWEVMAVVTGQLSSFVWARCSCGYETQVPTNNLTRGLSKRCHNCARKAMRKRSEARMKRVEAEVRAKGATGVEWRWVNHHWKVHCSWPCPACGNAVTGQTIGRKCNGCARYGIPLKHPIPLRVIADAVGVTKQMISDYARRHGWDAMVAFYDVEYLVRDVNKEQGANK